jgi:hypothetical protein
MCCCRSDKSCVSARRSFNEFLAEAGKDADNLPKSLDDLSKAGIRLTLADATDPDGVGFVQWRVAFYVAGEDGSVLNFFNLFDDFLVQMARGSTLYGQARGDLPSYSGV